MLYQRFIPDLQEILLIVSYRSIEGLSEVSLKVPSKFMNDLPEVLLIVCYRFY